MTYRLAVQSFAGAAIFALGVYATNLDWTRTGSPIEMVGLLFVAFAIYDAVTKRWKR